MNSSRQSFPSRLSACALLALSCAFASPPRALPQTVQATAPEQASPQPTPAAPAAAENEAAQKRLARARSLAAIGKLAAAASELEALRGSMKDESVRDVASVLLMAIFVEMPDYTRAIALLDEAFRARAAGQAGDAATHSYFAIAGQTVNAARTHLERYRSFGVNVADTSELPAEAAGDIEQLRGLLDRVVEQAKSLHAEQLKGGGAGSRGLDAAALLEDAATVRLRISRHDQDRARWQAEVSEARQHLFSSDMRIASISAVPAARNAAAQPAPAANTSARDGASQPANEQAAGAPAGSAQPPAARPGSGEAKPPAGGADKAPVAVGSLVGKARQRVGPTYPQLARTARVTGNVTVFLIVNEKGEVESVQRADGPAQLQQAAIEAARRWKFHPTVIDGQRVRVSGYLSFNFSL